MCNVLVVYYFRDLVRLDDPVTLMSSVQGLTAPVGEEKKKKKKKLTKAEKAQVSQYSG